METAFNHLPVVNKDNTLAGIVTAWDISKAVSLDKFDLVEDIMTRKVITAQAGEQVAVVARRLDQHGVSALPVINSMSQVVGIITSDDISKLFARRH
jgi:CBS domain-containing protein